MSDLVRAAAARTDRPLKANGYVTGRLRVPADRMKYWRCMPAWGWSCAGRRKTGRACISTIAGARTWRNLRDPLDLLREADNDQSQPATMS